MRVRCKSFPSDSSYKVWHLLVSSNSLCFKVERRIASIQCPSYGLKDIDPTRTGEL